MASVTKFYPTNNAAPYTPATWHGSWTSNAGTTRTLSDDKTGARVTGYGYTTIPGSNSRGIVRFVSNPLGAQTISGTLDMVLNINESNADANFFTRIYAYVIQGDSDSIRGVLLNFADTGGTEWDAANTSKVYGLSSPQTLSSVAVTAGDRLVIEFGVQAVAGSGSSRTASVWAGATNRNLDGTINADAVVGDIDTGITRAGYFVFSNAITVSRVDAASGDLLAGNQSLYLYNGTTGALKRRILPIGSQDPAGGCQLQSNGTLYISYESLNSGDDIENGQVAMYDPTTLAYSGLFQVFPGVGPHSLAANTDDEIVLGCIGDGTTQASCGEASQGGPSSPVTPASAYLRKFDDAGALLDTYVASLGASGTNSIDLAQDNATVYYTSLDRVIRRYDIVNDVQLSDFATLPAATSGEMARGIRILPDATVLVADVVNVKRLNTDGTIKQTYSVASQVDWGTLALSPTGAEFWVANRADSAISNALIAKFDVEAGTLLVSITQDAVTLPDTGGGMCSGGITCMNGFRAAFATCVAASISLQPISGTVPSGSTLTLVITAAGSDPLTYQWYVGESGDTSTPILGATSASYTTPPLTEDVNYWVQVSNTCGGGTTADSDTAVITIGSPAMPTVISDPFRWVRRSPTVFNDGHRMRVTRFQVDFQPGVGLSSLPTDESHDPIVRVRSSGDGGFTWSGFREITLGALGEYMKLMKMYQFPAAYNWVVEISGNTPTDLCIVQAWLDAEPFDH